MEGADKSTELRHSFIFAGVFTHKKLMHLGIRISFTLLLNCGRINCATRYSSLLRIFNTILFIDFDGKSLIILSRLILLYSYTTSTIIGATSADGASNQHIPSMLVSNVGSKCKKHHK